MAPPLHLAVRLLAGLAGHAGTASVLGRQPVGKVEFSTQIYMSDVGIRMTMAALKALEIYVKPAVNPSFLSPRRGYPVCGPGGLRDSC